MEPLKDPLTQAEWGEILKRLPIYDLFTFQDNVTPWVVRLDGRILMFKNKSHFRTKGAATNSYRNWVRRSTYHPDVRTQVKVIREIAPDLNINHYTVVNHMTLAGMLIDQGRVTIAQEHALYE